MTTITLRTLVRDTRKVKRMVRPGKLVQVTDNGEPLWVIHPAKPDPMDDGQRQREIEAELEEVLSEKQSSFNLSKLVIESRR